MESVSSIVRCRICPSSSDSFPHLPDFLPLSLSSSFSFLSSLLFSFLLFSQFLPFPSLLSFPRLSTKSIPAGRLYSPMETFECGTEVYLLDCLLGSLLLKNNFECAQMFKRMSRCPCVCDFVCMYGCVWLPLGGIWRRGNRKCQMCISLTSQ